MNEYRGNRWWAALKLLFGLNPGRATIVVVLSATGAMIPVTSVYLTTQAVQQVADAATTPGMMNEVLFTVSLMAGVSVFMLVNSAVRGYVDQMLQMRMANLMQERILRKSLGLDLSQFEDPDTYDSLQRASREAPSRPYQVFSELIAVSSSAVSLFSVSALLFTWNVWVALAVICAPIPAMISNAIYGRIGWEIENNRSSDRRRVSYLQFLLTKDASFKEIRLFGLGPVLVDRFRDMLAGFFKIDQRVERRQSWTAGSLNLLSMVASGAATLFAAYTTVNSGEVGQFAGFLAAIVSVGSFSEQLLAGLGGLYEHHLFLGNLFDFLNLPVNRITGGKRPFPKQLRIGIEFKNVEYRYPNMDTPVMSGLNLRIPAGRCVALVGHNGAGKSTLVKLLVRFYEPTAGQILLEGHPIEEYDLDDLRRNMSVIFQDFIRYEAPLRDNIGFGRIERMDDDKALLRAAREAGAEKIIKGMSDGLDTQLGRWFEGGQQLSGGQWQKIALSRAFLRSAPILVLDEPTSAIDAAAEAEIFGRIRHITGNATSLLIAHRFSTVRVADHIVVLEKGAVLEQGTHAELMRVDGTYAHLFRTQAAGYLDDPAATTVLSQVNGSAPTNGSGPDGLVNGAGRVNGHAAHPMAKWHRLRSRPRWGYRDIDNHSMTKGG